MCAQRGSPIAADDTGGAPLSSPAGPGAARYERVGAAAVIAIRRPQRRNAIDGPTAEAMVQAVRAFNDDPDARVLVVTGDEEAFCAGADLTSLESLRPRAGKPEGVFGVRRFPPKPAIAAISSWCLGGGVTLATWCDLRIAADTARFGFPDRQWGVPILDGGTDRLAAIIGPPGSGNGGYTAGRLAALIGDPAEITLRRPPPLETEMRVERAGPRLLLMHGEDLIAEAQKTVVELAIPECPSLHEARSASTGYPGLDRHPFPGCFVCGPQRAADGMAVFPGPLTDGRAWAAVWSAAETADAGPADVLVWAAMDCPGGWSISATDPAATYVLGRMAGQRIRPLDAAPVISLAWLIGRAARKATAGSALFTADGELCAYSMQTWIRLARRDGWLRQRGALARRPGDRT
jgi:Enoyl-CoA hydratase/isomerase